MRVLLIKTSSMGDIIHTLPALVDASRAISNLKVDWVVENAFAEIPTWHPCVERVIPISLRKWRKNLFSPITWSEWQTLIGALKSKKYDLVLDAQSLIKSAFLTLFTEGKRIGLDWKSARESFSSLFYQEKCTVNFYQHAIIRMRELFSQALAYPLPSTSPQFGLNRHGFQEEKVTKPYLVFLHGTTWASKEWPESYWGELAMLAEKEGFNIKISGGDDKEVKRAMQIATYSKSVEVLPRLSISKMAALLANSHGAFAVDTGFGHLAAALGVPTVSLYGATDPELTGALGESSCHLRADFHCSPCFRRDCAYKKTTLTPACFAKLAPALVFSKLKHLISH